MGISVPIGQIGSFWRNSPDSFVDPASFYILGPNCILRLVVNLSDNMSYNKLYNILTC